MDAGFSDVSGQRMDTSSANEQNGDSVGADVVDVEASRGDGEISDVHGQDDRSVAEDGSGVQDDAPKPRDVVGPPDLAPDVPRPVIHIDWVPVEGLNFWMGTAISESPEHLVLLQYPFEVSRSEVTVEQYRACVEAGACTMPHAPDDTSGSGCNWGKPDRGECPINCVDWSQAVSFAAWVGGRLPSEAEWEFLARGQDKRTYPWPSGTTATCDVAAMFDEGWEVPLPGCGLNQSLPVCSFPDGNDVDNGLCDLAGNVFEWTADDLSPTGNYEGAPNHGEPWVQDPRADERIVRGGGWRSHAYGLGSARRASALATGFRDDLGFRVVRDADRSEQP